MILVHGTIDGLDVVGFFESVEAARLAGYRVIEKKPETAEGDDEQWLTRNPVAGNAPLFNHD